MIAGYNNNDNYYYNVLLLLVVVVDCTTTAIYRLTQPSILHGHDELCPIT